MGFKLKTRSSCARKPGSSRIAYSIHTFVESVLCLWSCFSRAVLDLYLVFDLKRGRLERLHCVNGIRCNSRVHEGLLDGFFGGVTSLAGARESALPPPAPFTICVWEGQKFRKNKKFLPCDHYTYDAKTEGVILLSKTVI